MRKTEWKPRQPEPHKSSAKRWWLLAAVLVVLFGGGGSGALAWWRYVYPPEDPQVTKVKALQQQVFAAMEAERNSTSAQPTATTNVSATVPLTPQQREAAMTELRTEMEKLTDEQRRQVMRSMGNNFRERMQATIKEYRALPKENRTAFLDQQIDEMEQRRVQFQRAGGGGPGGGAPRGGPPRAGGNGNNGRDRGPPSPERRLEWRRNMLAETTPQERAEAEMFFSDLNERREQRGLEPMGPGGRR